MPQKHNVHNTSKNHISDMIRHWGQRE